MRLFYTNFRDFEDNIGFRAEADCYESLREAVSEREHRNSDCYTIVRAPNNDSVYYAVVDYVPTTWSVSIQDIQNVDYNEEMLPGFDFWEGEIIED